MENKNCPMDCYDCWLAGNSIPDWPLRKECTKLEKKLISILENEGGICKEEEYESEQVEGNITQ